MPDSYTTNNMMMQMADEEDEVCSSVNEGEGGVVNKQSFLS
jgi:hypothetical protein